MPRPQSFIDTPQDSDKPYDFELRGPGRLSVSLIRKMEHVATVKRQDTELTPRLESGFDLLVGRTTVRTIGSGDTLATWLAFAELLEGRTPTVCIEVSRPGLTPIASEARLRYRLWAHRAAWALYDLEGRLVLSFHPAWRDSEAARHMVGGLRLQMPLPDEDARLTAIAASLFWPLPSSIFDLNV